MEKNAPPAWRTGYLLLLAIPFVGMALTFLDPPRWLQVTGVVVIVALVVAGTRLMRRRQGGWRPSETLPKA
ncbi:hypothetical protein WDZ17_02760 [Pseudokineococcus basanitobsidens]|uniref:Uncharacterized protein n=1 Tax=Pseudokineococcus basanitobsidens TaxID=1926649 RepID=A0ABU8RGR2_9ACTN